jgi:hypothetical protein
MNWDLELRIRKSLILLRRTLKTNKIIIGKDYHLEGLEIFCPSFKIYGSGKR